MTIDIKKFVESVFLLDVFLRSQSGNCRVLPRLVDPSKVDLTFDFNAGFECVGQDKILLTILALKVVASDKETKEVKFDLSAEYVLAYNFQSYPGDVSEELFKTFTNSTALFNAYPYLREAVHTMSYKMGIPPVIAPLLKIEPPKTDNKENVVTCEVEPPPPEQTRPKKSKKKKQ